MARENSFSDSDGRSLTPDLEDELEMTTSPIDMAPPALPPLQTESMGRSLSSPHGHGGPDVENEGPLSAPASFREESRVRSPRTATSHHPHGRPHFMTPGDRFRATVRKVIAMRRGSVAISRGRIGAEPGIDPRRESAYLAYGHIRQKCLIEVVDYSSVRSSFGRMTNSEFIKLLADPGASRKEPWVKVRWINVGGVSWDVISALAIKYGMFYSLQSSPKLSIIITPDMHPLALEDLLHVRNAARSKADYYQRHLFLRVLCHTLQSDDAASQDTPDNSVTHLPRSSSPIPIDDDEDEEDSMAKNEDDQTMYGSQSASRFATKRSGTLTNTVKRKLNKLDDLEAKAELSAEMRTRFGDSSMQTKVGSFLYLMGSLAHTANISLP